MELTKFNVIYLLLGPCIPLVNDCPYNDTWRMTCLTSGFCWCEGDHSVSPNGTECLYTYGK